MKNLSMWSFRIPGLIRCCMGHNESIQCMVLALHVADSNSNPIYVVPNTGGNNAWEQS